MNRETEGDHDDNECPGLIDLEVEGDGSGSDVEMAPTMVTMSDTKHEVEHHTTMHDQQADVVNYYIWPLKYPFIINSNYHWLCFDIMIVTYSLVSLLNSYALTKKISSEMLLYCSPLTFLYQYFQLLVQ